MAREDLGNGGVNVIVEQPGNAPELQPQEPSQQSSFIGRLFSGAFGGATLGALVGGVGGAIGQAFTGTPDVVQPSGTLEQVSADAVNPYNTGSEMSAGVGTSVNSEANVGLSRVEAVPASSETVAANQVVDKYGAGVEDEVVGDTRTVSSIPPENKANTNSYFENNYLDTATEGAAYGAGGGALLGGAAKAVFGKHTARVVSEEDQGIQRT